MWRMRNRAHLLPADAAVVLGALLAVWVLHQGQVLQGGAPAGRGLLARAPPEQAHRQVGGVVVLEEDPLNLKHRQVVKRLP